MVSKDNVNREYFQDSYNLDKKRDFNIETIDKATGILRKQAAPIAFDIKNDRDNKYCKAKLNVCRGKNKQLSFSELFGHHIQDIDQYIADYHTEFFKEHDIFSEIDRQKFLDEVEDYGLKELNTYYNIITVCHDCSREIHKDVSSHIIRLRRIARIQTDSWDNQKKILDYFPEHKKISTELSEVKETLNRISIDLTAKEKDKESYEKVIQNQTADLETLRKTCIVLTSEVKNYENRLIEKEKEPDMIIKQFLNFINSFPLKTESDNKAEEKVGEKDIQQEQVKASQKSINSNDKKISEKKDSEKNAYRLHEILNEELSFIAKKRITKLISILNKLESKRKTEFIYAVHDRGYAIYNNDKIEILRILLTSRNADYSKDIGLTLYAEENNFEYGNKVGTNWRYARMKKYEKRGLERLIERVYDAAVRDNKVKQKLVIIQ